MKLDRATFILYQKNAFDIQVHLNLQQGRQPLMLIDCASCVQPAIQKYKRRIQFLQPVLTQIFVLEININ